MDNGDFLAVPCRRWHYSKGTDCNSERASVWPRMTQLVRDKAGIHQAHCLNQSEESQELEPYLQVDQRGPIGIKKGKRCNNTGCYTQFISY